ncbi:MAG: TVP38/TMEM64 family protein [Gammaproteobacteria bacterium]
MNKNKILLLLVIGALFTGLLFFDPGQYLNLETIKAKQAELQYYQSAHPFRSALVFSLIYILATGLSLPVAGILSVTGGVIFGFWSGTLIVSFASAIGATLAFLLTRYLFREVIQTRFADRLVIINKGIQKDGAYYLFLLRLVTVFPFFIINVLMAVTPISTRKFYLITQLGMLPSTMVFVNAGGQIAKINEPGDILSPQLLIAFALLGVFPLAAKKLAQYLQAKRHIPAEVLIPPKDEDMEKSG